MPWALLACPVRHQCSAMPRYQLTVAGRLEAPLRQYFSVLATSQHLAEVPNAKVKKGL